MVGLSQNYLLIVNVEHTSIFNMHYHARKEVFNSLIHTHLRNITASLLRI